MCAHVYHGKRRLGGRGRSGREKWMNICYSCWCQGRWMLGSVDHTSPPCSNCLFPTFCCWEKGDRMGQVWGSTVLQLLPEETGKIETVIAERHSPTNSPHPAIPLFPLQHRNAPSLAFQAGDRAILPILIMAYFTFA